MSISIFEKNDYKGITALAVYNMIATLNEDDESGKKNNILFMTSFGIVQAEEILPRDDDFNEETDKDKIFPDYTLQIALNSRDAMLKEYNNEELLLQNTAFILKNVSIRRAGSDGTTNVPIMILFSEDIIGLSLGHVD